MLKSNTNLFFRATRKIFRKLFDIELIKNEEHYLIPQELRRRNDFIKAYNHGRDFFEKLKFSTNYKNNSSILDVGCGDGSVAAAFARAHHVGKYDGFDIDRSWIQNLNSIYSTKENFCFFYANIFHSYYNKSGEHKPENYQFEITDTQYDVIFLNSIFSHMKLNIIENYLRNCKKFLETNGEIYATMYVYDDNFDASSAIDERFKCIPSDYYGSITFSPNKPEHLLAHPLKEILQIIDRQDLTVERYLAGTWYHRMEKMEQHGQDVFILKHKVK